MRESLFVRKNLIDNLNNFLRQLEMFNRHFNLVNDKITIKFSYYLCSFLLIRELCDASHATDEFSPCLAF